MTKTLFSICLLALGLGMLTPHAQAGRFSHCECVVAHEPPKGVFRVCTHKLKKEWEYRQHCLPCGRTIPYKVKVITYRERYSDGSSRTWKCVVAGSEVTLAPAPVK